MLTSLQQRKGYVIRAQDGDIGSASDFLFDDQSWAIRYMVVETKRFFGPEVLIAPGSIRAVLARDQAIVVDLTRDKVKNSPPLDADKPISRQYQRIYLGYYGLPTWWEGAANSGIVPPAMEPGLSDMEGDPHLRSSAEITGYSLQAKDGSIGKVDDYLVDDDWQLRYLVVDTSKWWFGRSVLISPVWARQIDWAQRLVHVDLTRQAIKDSPEWRPGQPVGREYEVRLHQHYGRAAYWAPKTT